MNWPSARWSRATPPAQHARSARPTIAAAGLEIEAERRGRNRRCSRGVKSNARGVPQRGDLDIAGLVGALGHVGGGQVGERGERVVELARRRAASSASSSGIRVLERATSAISAAAVASSLLRLGLADRLRRLVAPRLRHLQLGRDRRGGARRARAMRGGLRRQPAPREARRRRRRGRRGSGGCRAWRAAMAAAARAQRNPPPGGAFTRDRATTGERHARTPQQLRRRRRRPQDAVLPQRGRRRPTSTSRSSSAEEQDNPADRDQKTDAAGQAPRRSAGRRQHDGRDRFPPAGGGSLRRRDRRPAQAPRARRRFREADRRRAAAARWASCANIITRRSSERLEGELAKDLTGHPVARDREDPDRRRLSGRDSAMRRNGGSSRHRRNSPRRLEPVGAVR